MISKNNNISDSKEIFLQKEKNSYLERELIAIRRKMVMTDLDKSTLFQEAKELKLFNSRIKAEDEKIKSKIEWLRLENKRLSSKNVKYKKENDRLKRIILDLKINQALRNINSSTTPYNKLKTALKIIKRKDDIKLIKNSRLFDESTFRDSLGDNSTNINKLIINYIEKKALFYTAVSDKFDAELYLKDNKDVELSQMNPLLHYLKYGLLENRLYSKLDKL